MRERPATLHRETGGLRHRVLLWPARARAAILRGSANYSVFVRLTVVGDRRDDEPAALRIVGEIKAADLAAIDDADARLRILMGDSRFTRGAFPGRHLICGGTNRIEAGNTRSL